MEMIGQLLTGRYLVLKTLGSGGFGDTYLARDKYLPHHPLCVVKCLSLSSESTISQETARRLFETEARVLDQLGRNHNQIPTLYAHCHEQDYVYQVQEYIDGENLGGWVVPGQPLSGAIAVGLLLEVLPILEYIHSHNVIHRDINPSNLIRRNRDGRVVLIDFGAACIVSKPDEHPKSEDEHSIAIGTPGYMPYEQEDGAAQFNSDLYALGATVIHLLTGIHPQKFEYDPITGELDWQFHLYEVIDPRLVTILNRMVQRNYRDRYQQATEVLAAVRPLKQGRPLQRWDSSLRRRSPQPWLKPIAVAVLIASAAAGYYGYTQRESWGAMLSRSNPFSPASDIKLTLLRDLPVEPTIDRMLVTPNSQVLVTAGADHLLRVRSLSNGATLKTLTGHTAAITALDISQDSRLLVSGSDDQTIRLWDIAAGKPLQVFTGEAAVTAVAISPDAQTLASSSNDGTLKLWNLKTGQLLQTLSLPQGHAIAVAYAGNADRLISASSDRQIQVWDLRSGQLQRTFAGHTSPIVGLRVADDHTLFSFDEDQVLEWDLQREELVRAFSEDSAKLVTAGLDDKQMMTVYDNGSIRVWTRNSGWLVTTLTSRWQNLRAVLSPNHRYLACWSPDQRLRLWQVNVTAMQ